MKKLTITLAGAVLFLLGFQASELLRTPNNATAQLKKKIVLAAVEHDLIAMYRAEGKPGLDKRCEDSIAYWGYYFTCHSMLSLSTEDRGDFAQLDLVVYPLNSAAEANEVAVFRRGYDHGILESGTRDGRLPYYYEATAASPAHFTLLGRHPSTTKRLPKEF